MKKHLLLLFLVCQISLLYSQTAATCNTATPICNGTVNTYPSSYGSIPAEVGPNYGCLGSQLNPAWFYFKVDSSGSIVINISQLDTAGIGVDVDFVCWGPFSSPTTPCSGGLTGTALDCSYSTSYTEQVNVAGTAGNYYILMITNFSNLPANVTFNFDSTSTGTVSCEETCVTNAYNNAPLCVNGTLQLLATNHFGLGNYNWTGPNGFASSLESPTISSVSMLNEGWYTLNYVRDSTCNVTDSIWVNIDTCGTLTGHVFADMNSNCSLDTLENLIPLAQLKLSSGGTFVDYAWTDPFGYYYFDVFPGTYTIEVVSSPSLPVTCPTSVAHLTTVSPSIITTENFAVDCGVFDLASTWIGVSGIAFFPGASHYLYPSVSSIGPDCSGAPIPGEMILILDPLITYTGPFASATPPTTVIPAPTGDTLKWSIADITALPYYAYMTYGINYTTSSTATIGDIVDLTLIVLPITGDADTTNNTYNGHFIVGNSYDPNNKEVSPKGTGVNGYIPANTPELDYIVNFQNTGTAPAINIFILDTLDVDVDITTLKIISSSHPMTVLLLPGNVLKFNFSNIFLSDSTSNEAESHGYVRYSIAPVSGLSPGDQITNTAYIYFDFNSPIVTNTAINTIEFPFSINEYYEYQLGVFPNPTNNSVNIVFEDKMSSELSLRIMNVAGQVIYSEETTGFSGKFTKSINLNTAPQGIYLLEIITDKQIVHKKIIKN